jgi:signal peptidase II
MRWKNYLTFAIAIFLCDRLTKWWALQTCMEKVRITSFFSCQIVFNRGISWSLLTTESLLGFIFVTSLVMIVIAFVSWYAYVQFVSNQLIWAEIAIIAAACSNVLDRFWYGGVIDFILLEYNNYSWPLFNIADSIIVGGIFYMFWSDFFCIARVACKK